MRLGSGLLINRSSSQKLLLFSFSQSSSLLSLSAALPETRFIPSPLLSLPAGRPLIKRANHLLHISYQFYHPHANVPAFTYLPVAIGVVVISFNWDILATVSLNILFKLCATILTSLLEIFTRCKVFALFCLCSRCTASLSISKLVSRCKVIVKT